jgi:hypothetical protein
MGLNLKYGYGMTETTATVCCYEDTQFRLGSIGTALNGIEVKLGENNELLVRAPTVMRGYYNKPEATAEVMTEDGFLRTGDAGELDDEGNIYFTERLKELMKTSNGKYVAPQLVEGTSARIASSSRLPSSPMPATSCRRSSCPASSPWRSTPAPSTCSTSARPSCCATPGDGVLRGPHSGSAKSWPSSSR